MNRRIRLTAKDSGIVVPQLDTPQEAFDRWRVAPSAKWRHALELAVRRTDAGVEHRDAVAWAFLHLDSSPLGERRPQVAATLQRNDDPLEGDDPRDLMVEAMRQALKSISAHTYGMQAIIEECGDDDAVFNERAYEYYRTQNEILRMKAYEALGDLEAIRSSMNGEVRG